MKRHRTVRTGIILCIGAVLLAGCTENIKEESFKDRVRRQYGENRIISGMYDETMGVACNNGVFVGQEEGSVVSYKGIPYAEPPTGPLRWKSPVPAQDSEMVREAFFFGHAPVQTEWPSEPGSYYPQSEDCLTLNIWTNRADTGTGTGKPVMVFFHGGSYGWGAVSDPMYDGHNLVEKYADIILVTVEYRAGLYGFIDFSMVPGGEEFMTSGNLGLLDQICALKWIQRNISGFGGDPDNVTIFGESAGGGSVSLLPLIDGTEGLFRRVISESGSICLTYSKDECRNLTRRLLKETGCSTMDELTALSEEEIAAVNRKLNDYNNFPERDGVVLPEDLYGAYEEGKTAGLDLMIGTNSDEVRYWINELGYYTNLVSGKLIYRHGLEILYENNISRITQEDRKYLEGFFSLQKDKRIWNLTEFYNEVLFRIPALRQAALHAQNGGKAYNYYFSFPGADETCGACHAMELAYVFDNLSDTIYTGGHVDEKLADTIQSMWVRFARNGDPGTDEIIWEPYSPENPVTMVLGERIYMEEDLKAEQRKMIEPLLDYYFNGCYSQLSLNVPYVYKTVGAAFAAAAAAVFIILMSVRWYKHRK